MSGKSYDGRSQGFTLFELLLVVALIGVIAAVTFPSFVGAIQGSRLRAAARSIVSSGRYARSMAVLKQREVELAFTLGETPSVTIRERPRADAAGTSAAAPANGEGAATGGVTETFAAISGEPAAGLDPGMEPAPRRLGRDEPEEIIRTFQRVRIEFLDADDEEGLRTEGQGSVVYRSNGTCTPYRVKLVDDDGAWVLVTVDALGSPEIETAQ